MSFYPFLHRIRTWALVLTLCYYAGLFFTTHSLAACVSSPSAMLGWWPAEGNANDAGGTNNGSLQGGATASGAGMVGTSFTMDGTNGYVAIPDNPSLRPTNFTVECWVLFTGLDSLSLGGSPAGDQYIVFKQNSKSSDFEGIVLAKTRVGASDFFCLATTSAGGTYLQVTATNPIVINTWYHIAGVRGSNYMQIFVNGQLHDQTTVAFPQDYGTLPLYFGTTGQNYWDHKFRGRLDEVSLYSRALAPSEILGIYNAGSSGKCSGPRISVDPVSQSVLAGTNVTFSVTASGSPPLSYQWLFNGTILPSATSSNLVLTNVQAANAGPYQVAVSNSSGSTTSAVALLTILVPPSIATQPQNQTVIVGNTATFSATVTGTAPLAYQWFMNGTNLVDNARIMGSSSNVLAINSVQLSDATTFFLIATNQGGSVTSAVVTLTVTAPPTITSQPSSLFVTAGTNVGFSVSAAGGASIGYRWQRNGSDVVDGGRFAGASTSLLTISGVQVADSANYQVIVTNTLGATTSAVANLTVTASPVAPTITLQPGSQTVPAGNSISFTVAATGTMPLSYQWQKNGTNLSNTASISGVATTSLQFSSVATNDSGSYRVIVTNAAGAATSSVASLTVTQATSITLDALVLINSTRGRTTDFSHYIQPYLDNFGVPYTVQDISTNNSTTNLSKYSLIIIGQRSLDTNHAYLNAVAQSNIVYAVSNGVGLINFDTDFSSNGTNLYSWVQSVFGFTFTSSVNASSISFPPTEPGSTMHYATALHPPNDVVALRSNMIVQGLIPGTNSTSIVLAGGNPLLVARKIGSGRAMQWASDDWMAVATLGPLFGLDDEIWRGCVWAARKPFVLRSMPYFAAMRVDDCAGPFNWVHIANDYGFKPFLAVFINDVNSGYIPDLRFVVTNGMASASPHAFSGSSFIFWNFATQTAYSDSVVSNNLVLAQQFHTANGIPMCKTIATHYSAMGVNAFAGILNWGIEYFPIEIVPGTIEYPNSGPGAPWLIGGPYRLYEPQLEGQVNLPQYYSDWLTVPSHPEMSNKFYNCYPEIRDIAGCGEFCPDNDVAGTIARGTAILKRGMDSRILPVLFTHEWYIQSTPSVGNSSPITTANWNAELAGITNALANYHPTFVHLDYGNQYARALKTSKFVTASYNSGSGQISAIMSGRSDLPLELQVYTGADAAISNSLASFPVFTNAAASNVVSTFPVAPAIINPPLSVTNLAGSISTLHVDASGTAPLAYIWYNGNTRLSDGGKITGSGTSTLTLSGVAGTDAGAYKVVVTNALGSVTSSPPAILTVIDPIITAQPVNTTNAAGSTASFHVDVSGAPPLSYAWFNGSTRLTDGGKISGSATATLTISNVAGADAGSFKVVVTNSFGSVTSSPPALLVVNNDLGITGQPVSTTNLAGTTASFHVDASGTLPLAYSWYNGATRLSDGDKVSGSSTATLTISNVAGADAGSFKVVVTNSFGSVTSSPPALLAVIDPVITTQPAGKTNHEGAPISLSVTAAGTPPAYRWLKNAAPVAAATNSTYTILSASPSDSASYTVAVSNQFGNVTSTPAIVSVVSPLTITSIAATGSTAAITWSAIPGNSYALEYSDDLLLSNWNSSNSVTATGSLAAATNILNNATQRLFRVRLNP